MDYEAPDSDLPDGGRIASELLDTIRAFAPGGELEPEPEPEMKNEEEMK